MRWGEMIANAFAAIFVVRGLALIFLVAGRPLFPRRQARVVVLVPAKRETTSSIAARRQQLPASTWREKEKTCWKVVGGDPTMVATRTYATGISLAGAAVAD